MAINHGNKPYDLRLYNIDLTSKPPGTIELE